MLTDGGDRKASIGWNASGDDFDSMMQQRRSSSIGFGGNRNSMGMGDDEASRRPFVGGGSAAAYEAARADHYGSMGGKGGAGAGGGMAGMTVNPNQHYEMLKLHHMNLLNEIQETTLMMNLYQQQQLQQQQEQLSREGVVSDTQGAGSTGMFASTGEGQPASTGDTPGKADELASAQEQQQELEERLRKIKDDIATKQKEADDIEEEKEEPDGDSKKRKADKDDSPGKSKRAKSEKEGKKDSKSKSKK